MNRKGAARAVEVLAASPAAKWIGNKVVDGAWLQKCMRCGAEEALSLLLNVYDPEDVYDLKVGSGTPGRPELGAGCRSSVRRKRLTKNSLRCSRC